MSWLVIVRYVIIALMVVRIISGLRHVLRRQQPWTRLLMPFLIAMAAVLVGNHLLSRWVAFAAFSALELILVLFCIAVARDVARTSASSPEQVTQKALERYFPSAFAVTLATELTIVRHAWGGLRASLLPPTKSPFTYVHNNKFGLLSLVLAVSLIPDAILTHLLIPGRLWWLALLLDGVAVYSLIWVCGLYGTMVCRPHEMSPGDITVRRGLLAHAKIHPHNVQNAALSTKKIDGIQSVDVTLREPVTLHRLFLGDIETASINIASDMPEQLIPLLHSGAKSDEPSRSLHVLRPAHEA